MDRIDELNTLAHELAEYANGSAAILRTKGIGNEEKLKMAKLFIILSRRVGYLATLVSELSGITTIDVNGKEWDMWRVALKTPFDGLAESTISVCVQATNRAIGKLLDDIRSGKRDKQGNLTKSEKVASSSTEPPKAFISHGKGGGALLKLEKFLHELGIIPIIVKDQPSSDRSVDDKVRDYLSEADFVIIFATGDDVIKRKEKDIKQPRQNVIHEIGLAQKTHPGKIIYLLEEGSEFPSNIRPKVYESFARQSLDEAFTAIVRELRNWGFLRVGKS